jgi:hypothetical protein
MPSRSSTFSARRLFDSMILSIRNIRKGQSPAVPQG